MSAVAAGAVLSLMGSGVALAGSGPEPEQPPASGSAATEAGNPASVRAQAAGVCADAYQIGTTSYAYRQGEEIASVKQFYSPECNENYGYVWVWKSFLDKDITFDLTVGVWSYEREYVVGAQTTFDTHEQEFWSGGADTVEECTSGDGVLTVPGEQGGYPARTSKRC
ncbi:hypothetical protein RM572_01425 [Streptomyces sp. DSM 42041]|uniref:DUF2690 domain-containing protein n=1 Tax=Streptomyces hazeniae TaxID=3075538 RepID=A0ABU2NKB4_9ACTN|nr:hypothetical protein [Streptomyces sp. DSM 42041]MDT0377435.1 hypothetical protein [Streptomyces sp. DSM 42041]